MVSIRRGTVAIWGSSRYTAPPPTARVRMVVGRMRGRNDGGSPHTGALGEQRDERLVVHLVVRGREAGFVLDLERGEQAAHLVGPPCPALAPADDLDDQRRARRRDRLE